MRPRSAAVMLCWLPVDAAATAELATMVRAAGADDLAVRLERGLADDVKPLALTIDERAIILAALEEPPDGLAELRASSLTSTSGDSAKVSPASAAAGVARPPAVRSTADDCATVIERNPLPLWFGLWVGYVVTMLFLIGYQSVGDTTTRGWLATISVAFELWGVLLIASPELRPRVERAAAATWQPLRSFGAHSWFRIRKLIGIRRHHTLNAQSGIYITAGGNVRARGGRTQPPPTATLDEKVEYLLEQEKRHRTLINGLEDRVQEEMNAIRAELAGTAAELREHTTMRMREVAEAELNSRLLGVGFVMVGIVFAYAASVS